MIENRAPKVTVYILGQLDPGKTKLLAPVAYFAKLD